MVGKAFNEGMILRVAHVQEQACPWQTTLKIINDNFILDLIKKYVIDCMSLQFRRRCIPWHVTTAQDVGPPGESTQL